MVACFFLYQSFEIIYYSYNALNHVQEIDEILEKLDLRRWVTPGVFNSYNMYVLEKIKKQFPYLYRLICIGIGFFVGHAIFSNWNKVKEFIGSIFWVQRSVLFFYVLQSITVWCHQKYLLFEKQNTNFSLCSPLVTHYLNQPVLKNATLISIQYYLRPSA